MTRLRNLLEREDTRVRRVVIHGSISQESLAALKRCKLPSVSVEGFQQLAENAKREAYMNLFVIRPPQSGFASVAEATANAIKNPGSTAILIEEGEDQGGVDDRVQAAALADELMKHSDNVFTDAGELADHIDDIEDSV